MQTVGYKWKQDVETHHRRWRLHGKLQGNFQKTAARSLIHLKLHLLRNYILISMSGINKRQWCTTGRKDQNLRATQALRTLSPRKVANLELRPRALPLSPTSPIMRK
jgi:hypothetical protein